MAAFKLEILLLALRLTYSDSLNTEGKPVYGELRGHENSFNGKLASSIRT